MSVEAEREKSSSSEKKEGTKLQQENKTKEEMIGDDLSEEAMIQVLSRQEKQKEPVEEVTTLKFQEVCYSFFKLNGTPSSKKNIHEELKQIFDLLHLETDSLDTIFEKSQNAKKLTEEQIFAKFLSTLKNVKKNNKNQERVEKLKKKELILDFKNQIEKFLPTLKITQIHESIFFSCAEHFDSTFKTITEVLKNNEKIFNEEQYFHFVYEKFKDSIEKKEDTQTKILLIFLLCKNSKKLSTYWLDNDFRSHYQKIHEDTTFLECFYLTYQEFSFNEQKKHWYSRKKIDLKDMERLSQIKLCYGSKNASRKDYFNVFMFFLNQIEKNRYSGLKSKVFTQEISKQYSLSKSLIRFSKSDLLRTWFYLHNYGRLNSGRGVERWIIYRLWWKEKMTVIEKDRKDSTFTPISTSKIISSSEKSSDESNNTPLNHNVIEKILKVLPEYEEKFSKLENISKDFLGSLATKIDEIIENSEIFMNLIVKCIDVIYLAQWKDANILFVIWRILVLEESTPSLKKLLLESLSMFFQHKNEGSDLYQMFQSLRQLSYLSLDGKSIFKLDIEELSIRLQQSDLKNFFSPYHIFGTQLQDFNKYYFDQSVMNPENSREMLELLQYFDLKISVWNMKNLNNLIHDEFAERFGYDAPQITRPLKYQYSLLIPKIDDDFTTFFDIKQEFISDIYISSMENTKYCNCFVFEPFESPKELIIIDEDQVKSKKERINSCGLYYNILNHCECLFKIQKKSLFEITKSYIGENLAFIPRLNESMPLSIFSLLHEEIQLSYTWGIPRWRYCTNYQEAMSSLSDSLLLKNRNLSRSYLEEPNRAMETFIKRETIQSSKDVDSYYLVLLGDCTIFLNNLINQYDFLWIKIQKSQIIINLGEVKTGNENAMSCIEGKKEIFTPKLKVHRNIQEDFKVVGLDQYSAILEITLKNKTHKK